MKGYGMQGKCIKGHFEGQMSAHKMCSYTMLSLIIVNLVVQGE
jgi:hypothetical protein